MATCHATDERQANMPHPTKHVHILPPGVPSKMESWHAVRGTHPLACQATLQATAKMPP
ncbi:hypothetical protein HAX54_022329, partial [Datura stramonium]|nr:hypothetical protein [Datura stramonium]